MELEDVLGAVNWLGTPQELNVRRDNLLSLAAIDELVNISGVALVSVAHCREALTTNRLEDSEQRMLLLSLSYLSVAGNLIVCYLCLGLFLSLLQLKLS